jgi:hypothetical protein
MQTKRTIRRVKKTWCFEKINKIAKPLAKLAKRKRQKPKLMELEDITRSIKKSRGSLGNTSKTYILIDWKIYRKWTHF